MTVSEWIAYVDQRVWGPGMLVLLMGTGVFPHPAHPLSPLAEPGLGAEKCSRP